MMKLIVAYFVLALPFTSYASSADLCVDLFNPIKNVRQATPQVRLKGQEASIWGLKKLDLLTSMSKEFNEQVNKSTPFEKIQISNNSMIKETLEWMIARLEFPEITNQHNGEFREQIIKLSEHMKALKKSSKINYRDFLRVSNDFSYRIEKNKDTNLLEREFATLEGLFSEKSFFLLPSQMELSTTHINEMLAEGIMPLGLVDKPIIADNQEYSPSRFFRHDRGHAKANIDTLFNFDPKKYRHAYWSFKEKLQHLSEEERFVYENLWFLITHELFTIRNTEQEMANEIKLFLDPELSGGAALIHHRSATHSDLPKLSKDYIFTALQNMEILLRQ